MFFVLATSHTVELFNVFSIPFTVYFQRHYAITLKLPFLMDDITDGFTAREQNDFRSFEHLTYLT